MSHYNKIGLLLICLTPFVYAGQIGDLCQPIEQFTPTKPNVPMPDGDAARLFADEALLDEKQGISIFTGDVLMQRADQILKAPKLTYERGTESVNADGHFTFWDKSFIVSGRRIQLQRNHRGTMYDANYWLLDRRGHGHAEKIVQESNEVVHLQDTSYTTCDPNQVIWQLVSQETTLDKATSTGTAHDVTITVFGWPVFYTPYLNFPLGNDRKSGFLPPSMGSSDEVGLEFSIPYYWNMAPNYDATFTPRLMTRRGILLKNEFRYLTESTGGTLKVDYLPYDSALGEQRSSIAFQHNGQLAEQWFTEVNIDYASDRRYFEELGNTLSVASTTHLERRTDLVYIGRGWDILGRLQQYQTLDPNPAARPYERLPQLVFNTRLPEVNRQFNPRLQAEVVHFDRDVDVVKGAIGQRLDLTPSISYPLRTPSAFFIPKLTVHYTYYNLDELETDKGYTETKPDRFLWTASADSGLFFERTADTQWFGENWIQTLEPRLFYRYTPYKNQDNIPIFDTARYDFTFGQLFRENSFSGTDRIDDAHQISLALSSRWLNQQSGKEMLRTSIGQAYYLRDQRIKLPEESFTTQTDNSSSLIGEVAAQFPAHWSSSVTVRWNPHSQNTEYSVWRTRYQPDGQHILNLAYRLRQGLLEQTDVSGYWPIGDRWKIMGRWNYSLQHRHDLELFGGLEYHSCCWAMRGVVRRYLNSIDGSYLNGFFLEFELKGLGGIGKKAEDFLEQSIPGLNDRF